MTTDDVIMARIHLTKIDIILGQVMAEQDTATINGNPIPRIAENPAPTVTAQDANTVNNQPRSSNSINLIPTTTNCPATHHSKIHITMTTSNPPRRNCPSHNRPITRALAKQDTRRVLIPLIEVESDD
ncbi:hypothetical protein BDM02DRAFT_3193683 [Thelephora ganbajun]|uniref:Uncharacterized protein n=1 Tax=Thelephora ganbajun TaxID=370292 RepID=A0ACB6YY51_THEGA|nr:hypothetical protein BDM02DRAFT_3193683 [Thelephora ganbajun]